jgi:hypothetical protein
MAKAKTNNARRSHPANTESVGSISSPWTTDVKIDGLKSLTLPPTVKIKEMPVGAALDVTIYDLVPSQKKNIKNPLALAVNNLDGSKIAIPMVGGLAGTLLADKDGVDLSEVTKEDLADGILDARLVIKKIGFKESGEWKDDSGNPRKYPIFEVAVA